MINKSYAEWVPLLEKYSSGDDTILDVILNYSFKLDRGTTLPFYDKIQSTYQARKILAHTKFNREIGISNIKSISDLLMSLRNFNTSLQGINKFLNANFIPQELREILAEDFTNYLNEIKSKFKNIYHSNFEVINAINSLGVEKTTITNLNSSNTNTISFSGRKIIL